MAVALAAWPLMDDMGAIPMPGGWSLSTVWLPLCGQSWLGAWLHFTAMWAMMMVPMMLPAAVPHLWRYHVSLARSGLARRETLPRAMAAAISWAAVWLAAGAMLYPAGTALGTQLLQAPQVAAFMPAVSLLVGAAGAWWHLATWRTRCGEPRAAGAGGSARAALGHGMVLGVHCVRACAGLMAVLLAAGMMDWRISVAGAALVLGERLLAMPSILSGRKMRSPKINPRSG